MNQESLRVLYRTTRQELCVLADQVEAHVQEGNRLTAKRRTLTERAAALEALMSTYAIEYRFITQETKPKQTLAASMHPDA